jgi:hypothetical protein
MDIFKHWQTPIMRWVIFLNNNYNA